MLSVANRIMLFEQRSWNSFTARKTAFSSRWFMCKNLLSGRDQVPLSVCSFKWAPHPSFDASVKICRACFSGCNGWPWSTLLSFTHHFKWGWSDLGTGITFSSDCGTLQLFFKCRCTGLMWSRPRWNCFSVAVRRPMRDMNCWTGHTGPDSIAWILAVMPCQRSGVGLTLPSFRSNW